VARYSKTEDNGDGSSPPFGTPSWRRDFGQLGGRLRIDLDTRDGPVLPGTISSRYRGRGEPGIWDVPALRLGEVTGRGLRVGCVTPGKPTLASRRRPAGVGDYPFFESAFLGGASTLPGYHRNRFAGDAVYMETLSST